MKLENISANFLGDSITEGCGTSGTDKTFHQLLAKKYNMKAARNYGIGGTRLARQITPTNAVWDQSFADRFEKMDDDAQLVVLFGGTNDFGHGDAAIGDFTSRDVYTFYGALHVLCQKLIEKYPDAEIVFMTPLHRLSENATTNEYGIGDRLTLEAYVDIISEVTAFYGLPTLDLFRTSGLQPKVDIIREKYMPDGLHPSDAGAEKVAKRLYGFLSAL